MSGSPAGRSILSRVRAAAAAPEHRPQHAQPLAWAAVAVGGVLGTELRYGLGLLFPDNASGAEGIPLTTLAINVAGSFVLGFLTTYWLARPRVPFWFRAAIGPGILGSFTTFSAVVFAIDGFARGGLQAAGLLYLGLSLLLGLGAAFAGWALGRRTGSPEPW